MKSQGSLLFEDIRFGSGKQAVSGEEITQYEKLRSPEQKLSFGYFDEALKAVGVKPDRALYKKRGLVNDSLFYTNLALLLSDECNHTIKISTFEGNSKTKFIEHTDLCGSVLSQYRQACEYITSRYAASHYPPHAICEALSNAVIHRSYEFSGSILINIYSERIEILSIGGLIGALTPNDILVGMSQPRNPLLAEIFALCEDISVSGSGLGRIGECYRESELKVSVRVSDNVFIVSLPDLSTSSARFTAHEKAVMTYVLENSCITRKTAQELLKVSQTMAGRVVSGLVSAGLLEKIGSGASCRYIKK